MASSHARLTTEEIAAVFRHDVERVLPPATAAFGGIFGFEFVFHGFDGNLLLQTLSGLNAVVLTSVAWRMRSSGPGVNRPEAWALACWALITAEILCHLPFEPVLSMIFLSMGILTAAVTLMPTRVISFALPATFAGAFLAAWRSIDTLGSVALLVPVFAAIVGCAAYLIRRNSLLSAERQRVLERELERARTEKARIEQAHEKAQLENRLLHQQHALMESDHLASIGILTAGIAHQVNNPVGAILTSAELAMLESEAAREDSPTGQALREIQRQALRAGRLVRSVLHHARKEASERWSGDLQEVLRIAVRSLERWAAERDARIELSVEADVSKTPIRLNPLELEEAFVNLIRNGIEAGGASPRIRVRAALRGDEVEVLVEDNGTGVAEGDRDRLFEPFVTSRASEGGTGLGLHVARRSIESHGGRLELAAGGGSDADYPGACFVVRIPVEAAVEDPVGD